MNTPVSIHDVVLLSLLAGVLAVDQRSGWQSLLGHPVFAAVPVGIAVGNLDAALLTGLTIELVWLAVQPVRGARRPDVPAGAVVGTATACLILRQTGDPRMAFVVAAAAVAGLVAGELGAIAFRRVDRYRDRWLAGFEIPEGATLAGATLRLSLAQTASIASNALTTAATVAVLLPLLATAAERVTSSTAAVVVHGFHWWMLLVPPAIGVAAQIHGNSGRTPVRFLLLSAGLIGLVLWVR